MTDFDFREPDRFLTGTVGPPGERVFYLQAVEGGRVATLRIEKQQVAALVDSLAGILADLAEPDRAEPDRTGPIEAVVLDGDLLEPVAADWVIGAIGVAYDETSDRLLIATQELRAVDEAETDPQGDEPATARFFLSRAQVAVFVDRARALVAAGRPDCPFCGQPIDPAGHACPRMN
jgi:uncharacterized repeat protein (TIGR03847 family)